MKLYEVARIDNRDFQLNMALKLLKSKGFDAEIATNDSLEQRYVKVNQAGLEPSHLFAPGDGEDGWLVTGVHRAKISGWKTISTGNAYDVPFNKLVDVLNSRPANFKPRPRKKS